MVFNWKVKVRIDMYMLNFLWFDRFFIIYLNNMVDIVSMY